MSTTLIETRDDGTRVMSRDDDGARWIERDKSGGIVERVYIDSPSRFGPVVGACRLDRTKARPPTTAAVPTTQRTEDVDVTVPDCVLFTSRARRQLSELPYGCGVEIAGGLFGYRDGNTIVIDDVCHNGGDVYGTSSTTITIDLDYYREVEALHRDTTGYKLLGDIHSHELWRDENTVKASDADLRGWMSGYERSEDGTYVGLIVGPRGDADNEWRWASPQYRTHIVHRGADGKPTVSCPSLVLEPEVER